MTACSISLRNSLMSFWYGACIPKPMRNQSLAFFLVVFASCVEDELAAPFFTCPISTFKISEVGLVAPPGTFLPGAEVETPYLRFTSSLPRVEADGSVFASEISGEDLHDRWFTVRVGDDEYRAKAYRDAPPGAIVPAFGESYWTVGKGQAKFSGRVIARPDDPPVGVWLGARWLYPVPQIGDVIEATLEGVGPTCISFGILHESKRATCGFVGAPVCCEIPPQIVPVTPYEPGSPD